MKRGEVLRSLLVGLLRLLGGIERNSMLEIKNREEGKKNCRGQPQLGGVGAERSNRSEQAEYRLDVGGGGGGGVRFTDVSIPTLTVLAALLRLVAYRGHR